MADKQKVAILGGGIASIITAFELTSTPELRERYEVTVHQLGWRLGGKCASGRNAKYGQRIEEHGLHIWFGFYDNAFRVMRETYAELGRPAEAPLATWRDAFKPCDDIVLMEQYAGTWRSRNFTVPRNPLTPGETGVLPDFWDIAHTVLDYLISRWGSLKSANPSVASALAPHEARLPFGIDRLAEDIVALLMRGIWADAESCMRQALQLTARRASEGVGGAAEDDDRSLLWDALDAFKHWLWREVVKDNLDDDEVRFFFTMFDASSTMLQGIIADGLIEHGFEAVNGEDLREWLARHGAQPITIEQGPFVRALYDMAFAYEEGDLERPLMSAGTAMHDALRLFFTYRGSVCWKMQAGMGDTVFTPLYQVLEGRGVTFEFFHWISRLGLSEDRSNVQEIEYFEQVRVRDGAYQPFVDVEDLDCWPSAPDWKQIIAGRKLADSGVNLEWEPNPEGRKAKVLTRGEDFDIVVLGISVAALEPICGELIDDAANPRFAQMIEHSSTVMTQAFQVWLTRPLERLGWAHQDNSILTAFAEPVDTYANMSHLLAREDWPSNARVKDIAYFCGVLQDREHDSQQDADTRARRTATAFLAGDATTIWPGSATRGSFDWNLLAGSSRSFGPNRFATQFWRANYQPTERYVLTPPGSVQYRLRPHESGYGNLVLAGDWTKTGLDGGCVEAAVMSGMQASRSICGSPGTIPGEDESWLTGQPGAPAPPAELPAYVEYGGLASCPSPVDCAESTLYGFFLKGEHSKLLALCEKVFTKTSKGQVEIRPVTSEVMLTFGIAQRIEPQLKPWSQMGYATEQQVGLWIPVVLMQGGLPTQLGWFVPYMWVDNPLSLVGGREIYGFNKNWGEISLPAAGAPQQFSLQAFGGDYKGNAPAGWNQLMTIKGAAKTALATGAETWASFPEVLAAAELALAQQVVASATSAEPALAVPAGAFAEILQMKGPPQFFLRQFRAVSDGLRASPQQITTAGLTVKSMKGHMLSGPFNFELEPLDSHPVAAELGVQKQSVSVGFELNMDFVLEDGSVLWEA